MSTVTCPHCGGELEITAARRQPGHHDPPRSGPPPREPPRERKAWEREPLPWTPERARAFTMPIGKYKGRTIAQIGLADRPYVEWMAENLDRNCQKAAEVYLESLAEPASARTSPATSGAAEFDEFHDPEQ